MVTIDLRKVFDSLDHSIFLHNLSNGLLTTRYHHVKHGCFCSVVESDGSRNSSGSALVSFLFLVI